MCRNLALAGGIILLLAECLSPPTRGTTMFAGLPSVSDSSRPKSYLVLCGRLLVVLMFLTTLHAELSLIAILWDVVGLALILLVAVGCASPKFST